MLVVEDDAVVGLVLTNSLRALGHEVECVGNGEDAVRRLERGDIRIVVSDWFMPKLDGLELCRRLRTGSKNYIYFILLTSAEATEDNERLAMEAGVDDFLTKPISWRELRNRLRVAERILEYTTQVRQLESFLPICCYCKSVRTDDQYWQQLEGYISSRAGTRFSHGICPTCYKVHVEPQFKLVDRQPPANGESR